MAVALAGFGLTLGGCAAETGQTHHALHGDASVPAAFDDPAGLAESAQPDWRQQNAGLIEGCSGAAVCEAGERCCVLTGTCVPADCNDCCVTPELPAGPNTEPELDPPSGPDEPE